MPKCAAPRMIEAPVVSAANPWTGSRSTTFWPIVFMIRQPPTAVPSADRGRGDEDDPRRDVVRADDARREQRERDDAHRLLRVVRAVGEGHEPGREDLEPAEDAASSGLRRRPRKTQSSATMKTNAMAKPRIGDETSGTMTFPMIPLVRSPHLSWSHPAPMIVAPSRPPMSAWLLETGGPSHHVMRFHAIAPMSAAATIVEVVDLVVHEAGPDGLGDRRPGEGADEVERGRHRDRVGGPESLRRDRRRDRVRGVVEAVDVVEEDGERDDDDEEERDVLEVRGDHLRGPPWRPGTNPVSPRSRMLSQRERR